MDHKLHILARLLKPISIKFAQQLEELSNKLDSEHQNPSLQKEPEYEEPWHEEAIQEFGSDPISEQDYLEQVALKQKEPYHLYRLGEKIPVELVDSIFKKHGITAISSSGKEPLLGYGLFGMVFRAVYNNKPVIAKLILDLPSRWFKLGDVAHDHEARNWKLIQKNMDKIPSEHQQHLPQIHKIIEGKIDTPGLILDDDVMSGSEEEELSEQDTSPQVHDKLEYDIVIMEELFSLPPEYETIFNGDFSSQKNFKSLSSNPELVQEVAKNLWWELRRLGIRYQIPINGTSIHDLYSIADEIMKLWVGGKSSKKIIRIMNISEKVNQLYYEHTNEHHRMTGRRLSRSAIEKIINLLNTSFPRSGIDANINPIWKNSPETRSLLQTLEFLRDSLGLSWEDVHSGNIMIDRNGNFKIIDIGLYGHGQ